MDSANFILDKNYIRYGILILIIFIISITNNIDKELDKIFNNKIIKLIYLIIIVIVGNYDSTIMLLLGSLYLIIESKDETHSQETFISGKPDGVYKFKKNENNK